MSTSKHFNKICAVVMVLCLAVTVMLCFPDSVGIQAASKTIGYESKLFDTSYVHTIDIVMDDWDSFIENCESEEYSACAAVIDGEAYKNIAIRAKGNTSLSQVAAYGNDRYSFKIEFDHYDSSKTYYGLDKLCLNNIIQDNTYMKDYLCYTMMNFAGVDSPLCSFVYITVNGEDWGLYLAVEAVEDSFLERNYSGTGNLYKPDSTSMGGGRGNGQDFDQDDFDFSKFDKSSFESSSDTNDTDNTDENSKPSRPDFGGGNKGGFGGSMGSDDVKLVYTDDDFDSYSNIFDNAKTDIDDSDKTRLINSLKTLNSDDAASTVNVDEVIKYFAVHNFVCNFDSYTGSMIHNYYLYENDGILSMIPWDYNLAFGGFVGGSDSTSMINFPIDSPVSGGDTDSRPMLAWIFADEEYTELYHEALSEFIADYFESGYFEKEIDRVTALISPYVEKDPTKFCTYDEFTEGVAALKEFCTLRAKSVRGQLDGTIPSTSDEQSADSSALISGSSVSISAMGSMNGGNMGGNAQGGGFGTPPDNNGTPPEMPDSDTSNGQMPNFGENPPEMPNNDNSDGQSQNNGTTPPTSPNGETPNGSALTDAAPPEQQTDNSSENSESAETSVPEQNGEANANGAPSENDNSSESESGEATEQETAENSGSSDNNSDKTDSSAFSFPDNGNFGQPNGNNDQNRPQMPSDSTSSASSNTKTIVLLGVSAGALIAAIFLTKLFKDRI